MATIFDIKDLIVNYILEDEELPYRVKLIDKEDNVISYGNGITLGKAVMRCFTVSKLFPTSQFFINSEKEFARFLFWNFQPTELWKEVVKSLENNK